MAYKENQTYEELSQHLKYDHVTGVFTRKSSNKRWANKKAGTVHDTGYIVISVNNRLLYAHRLAFLFMTGKYPSDRVDHIDGDRKNNRWDNLRECNHFQNLANTGLCKANTSGHKGVTWDKSRNKWQAKFKANGKTIHLGRFSDFESAAKAHDKAYANHHGEFARAS
jgi:hypothetical protein